MEAAAVDLAVLVAEFLAVNDCLMVVAALVSFALKRKGANLRE